MELAFDVDPTAFFVVLAVSLAAGLVGMRALKSAGLSDLRAPWGTPRGRLWLWALLAAFTLFASSPVVIAAWVFCTEGSWLPGDAASHAQVAREIATHGLERGWIESYSAGFPFGPHYQSGALLLTAGLIWLGIPAISATHLIGIGSVLLVPMLFLLVARAAGASPWAALAGALLLSWAVPAHSFMGGPWPMLSQGLVAQVFAMPWIMLAGAAVLGSVPGWMAPLLAAVAMASHAQLTPCALLAGAPALLVVGSQAQRRRLLSAALGAGVSGLALYGPGVLSFALPFSWAPVPAFRIIGYGPDHLIQWWLDGRLLDVGRAPVLTGTVWAAVVVLLFTVRGRASRGVLVFFATTLVVSFGGHALAGMGEIGQRVVEIFSPVRMLCLIPVACAMTVCVALAELSARLRRALKRTVASWVSRTRAAELALVVWFAVGAGGPAGVRMGARLTFHDLFQRDGCRSHGLGGYRSAPLVEHLRGLERGRFVVDKPSSRTPCPVLGGIELQSSVPLGQGTGGPGSQVGVVAAAFDALQASGAGGAKRAEALGVRTILHSRTRPPAPAGGWQVVAAQGDAVVSERVGGTDLMGLGCISAVWRGTDRVLRDALFADLASDDPAALDPGELILLESTAGPLRKQRVARGACDPARASIDARRTGPGTHEAVVETAAPVTLVLRATKVETWTVLVDGAPVSARMVAPGFLSVQLDAGRHRVSAMVRPLPWYRFGLAFAVLALGLLAWVELRRMPGKRHAEGDARA